MTKYIVRPYIVCMATIQTEADEMELAVEQICDGQRFDELVRDRQVVYVDEIVGALVDVEGDTEFLQTKYFQFNDDTNRWEAQ